MNDTLMDQCRREAEDLRIDEADELREDGYDLNSFEHGYALALYAVASGSISSIGNVSIYLYRDDSTP